VRFLFAQNYWTCHVVSFIQFLTLVYVTWSIIILCLISIIIYYPCMLIYYLSTLFFSSSTAVAVSMGAKYYRMWLYYSVWTQMLPRPLAVLTYVCNQPCKFRRIWLSWWRLSRYATVEKDFKWPQLVPYTTTIRLIRSPPIRSLGGAYDICLVRMTASNLWLASFRPRFLSSKARARLPQGRLWSQKLNSSWYTNQQFV